MCVCVYKAHNLKLWVCSKLIPNIKYLQTIFIKIDIWHDRKTNLLKDNEQNASMNDVLCFSAKECLAILSDPLGPLWTLKTPFTGCVVF